MTSISRRLLVLLLGGVLATGLLSAVATYLRAREEVNELFDFQLRQVAASFSHQRSFAALPASTRYEPEDELAIQVWDEAGRLVYTSRPAPLLPRGIGNGLSTLIFRGKPWRVFLLSSRGRHIQVSQPIAARRELSASFALSTLVPLVVALPLLALFVWLSIRVGLRPLARIQAEIARRSPAMMQPLPLSGMPAEIAPLVERLNALLARLSDTLRGQQRFVADAAHELRTPLAALRLQVKLLEGATEEGEREESLRALRGGIDRAAHLVDQLLVMARLEPEAPPPPQDVALAPLAREVLAEQASRAMAAGVELGLSCAAPVTVRGDGGELRVLLANLVDNAIGHTPAGGTIDLALALAREGDAVVVTVTDSGPGIPPTERERVFERFYRIPGTGREGSGLGLAIVAAIVSRHGGAITLGAGPGGTGLCVIVRFPAPNLPS